MVPSRFLSAPLSHQSGTVPRAIQAVLPSEPAAPELESDRTDVRFAELIKAQNAV